MRVRNERFMLDDGEGYLFENKKGQDDALRRMLEAGALIPGMVDLGVRFLLEIRELGAVSFMNGHVV